MSISVNAYNSSSYIDISSFFSNSSSSKSNSYSSIYSGLTELSSIKSGTYKKLLNSYYSKVSTDNSSSTDTTDISSTQKQNKTIANDASTLYSSINSLSKTDFGSNNKDKIEKNVESFISNYNSLIDSASDSDTKSVLQKTLWLTNQTKANSNSLSKIGITINSDNTLSLDKTALSSASESTLNSIFSNNQSYLSNIKYQTSQIYTDSLKNSGILNTGSAYTNSGNYSNLSVSSLVDTLL